MAVSRLNPTAPPFNPPACVWPAAPRGGCWWCVSGGLAGSNGCTCVRPLLMAGVPVFPPPPVQVTPPPPRPVVMVCYFPDPPPPPRPVVMVCYFPAPPPPPASRCRIVEMGQDGSEEASKDEPFPRSDLFVVCSSRKLPAAPPLRRRAAMPSPPRLSLPGKGSRRRSNLLAFDPDSDFTSLMIRNIPNKFMKKRLLAILDQHCAEQNAKLGDGGAKSEYDFFYVPVDFWTKYNKGYAFVNLTTPAAARRLHAHLHGHCWEAARSKKVCDVVHAHVQGLDALVRHFDGSLFPCEDEELLPARFDPPRDGVRATTEHVVGRLTG